MLPVKKHAVSPAICRSKVILFLGAGASQPLDLPLMDSFMDVLEGEMDRKSKAIVQRMYTMPDKSRDLEILFDTFNDYDKIAHYFRHDPNFSSMPGRSPAAGVENLMGRVNEIRPLVEKVVLREYSKVPVDKVRRLYQDLILLFAESNTGHHVPVFTTNYDLAIEKLAEVSDHSFYLVDGFTVENVRRWDPSMFYRYRTTEKDEPTILLFKLHGSCQWRVNKDEPKEVTKESTVELCSPDSAFDNALMWPGETKRIKEGPHETNYNYLEQCLMNAEACLVIGFSFRDEVINRYFAKALDLNEKLKVALVDPEAETLAQGLLGDESSMTMRASQDTILVRRSDAVRIRAIPTRFEPDELPQIVKALLNFGFPLDSVRAQGLFP